jgi:VanZ family protein
LKLEKSRLITIGWALIILVLSLLPSSSLPSLSWSEFLGADKLAHLGVYMIFSFLLVLTFNNSRPKLKYRSAILFSSAYGILMEVLQFLIYTGRNFEFLDIIANIIGSFLGTIFFTFLVKYFNIWKV